MYTDIPPYLRRTSNLTAGQGNKNKAEKKNEYERKNDRRSRPDFDWHDRTMVNIWENEKGVPLCR